ncbi:hypothetical protein AXE65_10695 [Ventosimonas gracilis]|uniref:DUF4845 domain-containing protein n=2 Tax=Ventosimonas gracilis TaxID=1680762 RepID=A0A139SWT7_9GAMM|nr:hypothetical protein AXE65_10695 [Ventosimonas gracilis]
MKSITQAFPGKQKGASPMGILLAVVIILFVVSIAFKMVPHYMDYKAIEKSVEGLSSVSSGSVKTPAAFYQYMQKSMQINAIQNVKAEDIMKVERNGNQFTVYIDYERREPMIKNLSLIAHFKKELSVPVP